MTYKAALTFFANKEDDTFIVRYKVNRVMVINNLKSYVRELYMIVRHVNSDDKRIGH